MEIYIYALKQAEEVVYVGKTNKIKKRIWEHKKTKTFDNYEILEVLDNPTKRYVEEREDHFISEYVPLYNKTMNCGKVKLNVLKMLKGVSF